eukprot:scaffold2364_cov426-Prasinococcus_capsulatus_cf.AAC.9
MGEKLAVNLADAVVHRTTQRYMDKMEQWAAAPSWAELACAAWAIEAVYNTAWASAASAPAPYAECVQRWGNAEFGEYVKQLQHAADRYAAPELFPSPGRRVRGGGGTRGADCEGHSAAGAGLLGHGVLRLTPAGATTVRRAAPPGLLGEGHIEHDRPVHWFIVQVAPASDSAGKRQRQSTCPPRRVALARQCGPCAGSHVDAFTSGTLASRAGDARASPYSRPYETAANQTFSALQATRRPPEPAPAAVVTEVPMSRSRAVCNDNVGIVGYIIPLPPQLLPSAQTYDAAPS